jgi:glycosyltransferase involved in cell wall biosynthesis
LIKVSVIIPVYNAGQYLPRAIESALVQSMEYIEVIIVDDASTDGSGRIAQEYASKYNRVKYILLPKNRGTLYARYAGVMAASGDYVTQLDQDDVLDPDFCSRTCNIAVLSGADVVQASVCFIEPDLRITPCYSFHDKKEPDYFKNTINMKHPHNVWGKLIRTGLYRRVWEEIGEPPMLVGPEDLLQSVLLAWHCNRCETMSYTGFYHFKNPSAVTHMRSTERAYYEKKFAHYSVLFYELRRVLAKKLNTNKLNRFILRYRWAAFWTVQINCLPSGNGNVYEYYKMYRRQIARKPGAYFGSFCVEYALYAAKRIYRFFVRKRNM